MRRRSAAGAALALLGWLAPAAAAAPWDGAHHGTLRCDAIGTSPAFTQQVAVILRDGTGGWQGGMPGRDGFHAQELHVAADGAARLRGHYLVAGEARQTSLEGRAEAAGLSAEGRRGPRGCTLRLERAALAPAGTPYRLPWRTRAAAPRTAAACPSLVPLPRDLRPGGFYASGDRTASQVDPAAMAAHRVAVAELRRMEAAVSTLGDRAQRGDAAARSCLLGLLDGMAAARSLLGEVSQQGTYERKWALVTFALAFAENRDAAAPDSAARIAAWLRDYGDAVIRPYLPPPGAQLLSSRGNNHAYWAALAGLASGIATRDAVLFGWGAARLHSALGDIDAEGFLPRELARAGKALHYHGFALQPLLLGTLLLQANGQAPDAAGLAGLARLVARVEAGLDDPAPFVARTGSVQSFVGGPTGRRDAVAPSDWVWAELGLALSPRLDLEARVAPLRPLRHRWLGGDLTLRLRPDRGTP